MSARPLRVLYVDDDRINTLLFVQVCLPDKRLQVLTAALPEEALDLAREAQPELLVVDLHMPDTDGLQLLRQLRALPGIEQVPAILCTAERVEEVRESAMQAGFAAVWSKPVQLSGIQEALSRLSLIS